MGLIKWIWYYWFWLYVRIALGFYYRRIKISGKENIPKGAPIIFGANHENALIDPLIMTTRFPLMIHYLVRADVFNNPLVKMFLNSLNLMPVYRIRDGVNSVKSNEIIFKNCFKAFAKKESLILFPEASHDENRQLKMAKKGIARIALGAMHEPDAPKELYIIPVGMNYSRHRTFRSTVHIVFGEPIKVEKVEESNENIEALRKKYDEEVAKCCVSFSREKFDVLDKIFFHDLPSDLPLIPAFLNASAKNVVDVLNPETEEQILAKAKKLEQAGLKFPFEPRKKYWANLFFAMLMAPFALISMILHAPGLLLAMYIMKNIKDKVYKDTIFFGVGLILMPVTWLGLGYWVLTLQLGLLSTIGCIVLMPISLLAFSDMLRNWRLFRSNLIFERSKVLQSNYAEFLALIKPFRA